jgi:hypothetical protein
MLSRRRSGLKFTKLPNARVSIGIQTPTFIKADREYEVAN